MSSGPHQTIVRRLRMLRARLLGLFTRQRFEHDLEEEMRTHLELAIEDRLRSGDTLDAAHDAVRRSRGGLVRAVDRSRDLIGFPRLEDCVRDLRYGLRLLRRTPTFTLVAVTTLGLGIGANAVIFSCLDALVLRPLPIADPPRLLRVDRTGPGGQGPVISYPAYRRLLESGQSGFSGILATGLVWHWSVSLGSDLPERVAGELVSTNYFSVLGVRPQLGRLLEDEDMAGVDPGRRGLVAVLSHDYWMRRFAGAPDVIGRAFTLHGATVTIVGVALPGFFGVSVGDPVDLWMPLAAQSRALDGPNWLVPHGNNWLLMLGRLDDKVSREQAQARINAVYRQYIAERLGNGTANPNAAGQRILLGDGQFGVSGLRNRFSRPLGVLMAMVGVVLLIACVNLASLLLARAASRRPEMALRLALGAGRARIVRQLLVESALLATIGTALGLACAAWGLRVVAPLLLDHDRTTLVLRVNGRLVAFCAIAIGATALLSALVPALRATRVDVTQGLGARATRGTASGGRGRLGRSLVVAQVALALPLLVGAGLFDASLRRLYDVDLGFEPSRLLVVSVDPNALGYSTAQFSRLYHELLTRVATMPRVAAVGLSDLSPFGSGSRQRSISLRRPSVASLDDYNPHVMDVTADYFRAVGLPRIAGRTFDTAEVNAAAHVIVVNDSFARYYFGERAGAALGQRISFGGGNPRDDVEIIGIVGDTKYLSLREERAPHLIYVPFAPDAFPIRSFSYSNATLAIRVTGAAADTVAPAVRQQIAAIDPRLPVLTMMTMEEQVRRTLGQERLLSAVSGAFAGLALTVATIGLYGLLAYGVARRRAEMAVRLALGARQSDIRGLVLRDATATVAIGVAIGCGLAWLCGGVLGGLLYGVPANNPILMAGAAFVLAATAALAAWMPARSAARVPPATALRGE